MNTSRHFYVLQKFRIVFILKIAAVVFLLVISQHLFAQTQAPDKEQLEQRKQELQKQIDDLQKQLDATKKSKKVNLGQLLTLQKKIQARQQLINTYNSQIHLLNNEIGMHQKKYDSLAVNLDTLKAGYARMIYDEYKHRNASEELLFLFSAKDFNDAFMRWQYLRRYDAYKRSQAQQIIKTQAQINSQKTQLLLQKNNKQQLISQQQNEKDKLSAEEHQQNKMIQSLSGQEKQLKADLAKKQSQQAALKKQIADLISKEIESSSAATTKTKSKTSTSNLSLTPEAKALSADFAGNQGKLPWPVEKGEIVETFGDHPHPVLQNVTTRNNGVDIKTSANAVVRAVFKGTVVSIISNPGYHKAVLIRHGEYFSVYSNLSSVSVSAGQEVTTKQVIGNVYSDPQTGETVVHLEIWHGTSILDPENWIAAK